METNESGNEQGTGEQPRCEYQSYKVVDKATVRCEGTRNRGRKPDECYMRLLLNKAAKLA